MVCYKDSKRHNFEIDGKSQQFSIKDVSDVPTSRNRTCTQDTSSINENIKSVQDTQLEKSSLHFPTKDVDADPSPRQDITYWVRHPVTLELIATTQNF